MHSSRRVAGAIAFSVTLAAAVASAPQVAGAHPHVRRVVGHVYVNDNTASANTVAGFAQHGDGRLTPLPGSPFRVGGAGTGTIVGSQGAIQVTADGRFLLAVDAGSNQVSVARIHHDGSLSKLDSSPVSSQGVAPVSIAVHDDLVYVANLGNGVSGANYTGFRMNRWGRLVHLRNSTIPLPATANPGDILFNSSGHHLIGVEVGTTDPDTFLIDSFVVGRDGRLHAAPGSPFPAEAPGPFGSEFSPTHPHRLYVSNAHGPAGAGSVSAFSVSNGGALTSIGGSPYPNGQTAPCWVEISHDGHYLFSVNTGSTTLSSYRIQGDGSLRYLSSTPFQSGAGIRPFDARLDVRGTHLYVVDAALNAVSIFRVHGGDLDELRASPATLPAGATPFGIVVT
jgi:6-phosphogluconolactonase